MAVLKAELCGQGGLAIRATMDRKHRTVSSACGAFLFAGGLAALAAPAAADLGKAFTDSDFDFGIRYRLEQVRQDGIDEDATASTGRARLTWISGAVNNFSIGLEGDYAYVLGIDDFNSLANGRTNYPVIADPDGPDLNQAFIRYGLGDEDESETAVTLGRQRINHGTQRFIGGVAWRQNEQTFDAIRFQRDGRLSIDYSYLFRVNRIFGPDGSAAQPAKWDSNSHAFRAQFQPIESHRLAVYAYLLDFDNGNGPSNSNATWGAEYDGALPRIQLSASVARQTDWGDNPASYTAYQMAAKASLDLVVVTLQVGHERLGSDDGEHQFRTPLATLHKFQGWTDKYLVPPPEGVSDTWVGASKEFLGVTLSGFYHDFRAAEGDREDGHEVGVSLVFKPIDKLTVHAKVAKYWATDFARDSTRFARDTTKGWLMVSWNM